MPDDQIAKNIPTSSVATPSKIYPNWSFWVENEPSGNPGLDCGATYVIVDVA
jgi:hypothetical protein